MTGPTRFQTRSGALGGGTGQGFWTPGAPNAAPDPQIPYLPLETPAGPDSFAQLGNTALAGVLGVSGSLAIGVSTAFRLLGRVRGPRISGSVSIAGDPGVGGVPALGGHNGDWQLDGSGTSPQTTTLTTQTSGSSLIVCVLGDSTSQQTPTDNKSNTFTLLRQSGYSGGQWAPYDMRVYGKANAAGGSSHTVSVVKSFAPTAEATLIVIEGTGTVIQDSSIVARAAAGAGMAATSGTVTTTGPALLVSFWSGDGGLGTTDQTATPSAGWTTTDSLFLGSTAYIQAAAAVRQVSSAGTYSVDWTPAANQGAILFIAAIQA